ncbi:hypothetical protein Ddye_024102 [Dipteronia dyeriana]|uniref:O-methyltransferase n=1 Tax=Dipteronia dyeriana TaxID=168575 RepID=A0AAD9TU72_9ROSI|nr:hypothetical protein Ddye_024102 [Dipteronia dyeriana]
MDSKRHELGGRELFQAQSHLYKHIFSYISSMYLKCAVELGIPDILHDHGGQHITLPELVSALKYNPPKLVAYAAYCACWFREDGHGHGHITTPFESAHGLNFLDYGEQNPEFNTLFGQAMASDSQMANLVVKDCKPIFDGLNSLVDVGGTGSFSRILSKEFPHMKCTVFNLLHVAANSPDTTNNLNFIGGNMFQYIPSADAFLFKLVFHAYGDEDCVKILKKCREAISSKSDNQGEGKAIIIDIVIDEKEYEQELTEAKLFFDMLMMVVESERERNEKEWEKIFLEFGFSHYKITPLFGLRSLIEVSPYTEILNCYAS